MLTSLAFPPSSLTPIGLAVPLDADSRLSPQDTNNNPTPAKPVNEDHVILIPQVSYFLGQVWHPLEAFSTQLGVDLLMEQPPLLKESLVRAVFVVQEI